MRTVMTSSDCPPFDPRAAEVIRSIVFEIAPRQDVGHDPGLGLRGDLGYDSLALLEAVVAIEDELDVMIIDDGTTAEIETVADFERYVLRIVRQAGA